MLKTNCSVMLTLSSVNPIRLSFHPFTWASLQQHCGQLWGTAMYAINLTCLHGSTSACSSTGTSLVIKGPWLNRHGMSHWHGTAWHGTARLTSLPPEDHPPLCFATSCQKAVARQDWKITYLVPKELRMWESSCGVRYEGRKQNGQKSDNQKLTHENEQLKAFIWKVETKEGTKDQDSKQIGRTKKTIISLVLFIFKGQILLKEHYFYSVISSYVIFIIKIMQ